MSTKTRSLRGLLVVMSALAVFAAACGDDDDDAASDGGSGGDTPDASICVGGEFSTRPDGLPGLEEAYGFEFPASDVTALDEDSLVYNEVDQGNCTFGSIFATDGRVGALGLTVLEDDEAFFPPYNGSLNVRTEVLDEFPGIEELFAPVSEALDDATMIDLNAQVDVDGEDPADVAQAWLDDADIPEDVDLSGASLTVSSKEFTEQLILGHITKLVLEGAGADVDDQIGLVGSTSVRDALTSGEVDLYWEYLGTGWVTYLDNTEAIADPVEQYEAVRDADAANGVTWLEPAPFNNTYAIAVSDENAEALGITSISEIKDLIGS
ncbi:MAG TPA: glycine betaine ABC transporter substrate-binding protein [Acidimicrobiales bacterium]|nr:glycine betaine ABC transporter substrate-binding protein [Acidimicrobiales bacterium]